MTGRFSDLDYNNYQVKCRVHKRCKTRHTVLNITSLAGWYPTDLQHLCCKALINKYGIGSTNLTHNSQVKCSLHGTDWHKSGIFIYKQTLVHIYSVCTILPCMVSTTLVGTGVPLLATAPVTCTGCGRSVKLNKILRVHKLWPIRTTHHTNPYLPGRDFH